MYYERFWVLKKEILNINLNEYYQLLEKKLRHSNNHTFSNIMDTLEKEDPKNLSNEQCERICKTFVDMFEFISRDYKLESITEDIDE